MTLRHGLLCCGLLLTANLPAWALHPLITEDTGTQGSGVSQIELTASHESDRDSNTTTHRFDPTLVFTHGVTDTVDIFVSLPYLQLRVDSAAKRSGWSDPTLGFKWRFYEYAGLSMAVKPAVLLPQGNNTRDLGKGRTGYSLPFVMTRQWDDFAFHTHVAVSGNRNTVGEREHLWHGSLALEHYYDARLKWVLDLGVDRNPDSASNLHPAYLLGGLVHAFDRMELSAGIKAKLNAAAPDKTFLFGLTWHSK